MIIISLAAMLFYDFVQFCFFFFCRLYSHFFPLNSHIHSFSLCLTLLNCSPYFHIVMELSIYFALVCTSCTGIFVLAALLQHMYTVKISRQRFKWLGMCTYEREKKAEMYIWTNETTQVNKWKGHKNFFLPSLFSLSTIYSLLISLTFYFICTKMLDLKEENLEETLLECITKHIIISIFTTWSAGMLLMMAIAWSLHFDLFVDECACVLFLDFRKLAIANSRAHWLHYHHRHRNQCEMWPGTWFFFLIRLFGTNGAIS